MQRQCTCGKMHYQTVSTTEGLISSVALAELPPCTCHSPRSANLVSQTSIGAPPQPKTPPPVRDTPGLQTISECECESEMHSTWDDRTTPTEFPISQETSTEVLSTLYLVLFNTSCFCSTLQWASKLAFVETITKVKLLKYPWVTTRYKRVKHEWLKHPMSKK